MRYAKCFDLICLIRFYSCPLKKRYNSVEVSNVLRIVPESREHAKPLLFGKKSRRGLLVVVVYDAIVHRHTGS